MSEDVPTKRPSQERALDITGRDIYMRALRERSFGFLAVLTPDGRLVECNDAPLEAGGLERQQVLGQLFWETPWFRDLPEVQRGTQALIEEVREAGEQRRGEFQYRAADDSLRATDRVVTPINDDNGQLCFLLVEARDITEFKQAKEAELRESEVARRRSEGLVDALMNSVTEGVIVYDEELRYVTWNRAMEDTTGLSANAVSGKHPLDVFPHLREEGVDKLLERALAGETVRSEDRLFQPPVPDAEPMWIQGVYTPHFNQAGEVIGVVGIIHDITERKLAEENAIRLSREAAAREEAQAARRRVETILESISDCFIAFDREWRFIYINEQARRYWDLHLPSDQVLGVSIWELLPQAIGHPVARRLRRVMQTREPATFQERSAITNRWLDVHAYPSDEGLSVYFQDITEQKQAEAELVEAKEKAEEMTRLKSTLLANMSHEIRTPLTSILLRARILEVQLEGAQYESIDAILRAGERLRKTLDSILTLTQLEGEAIEPHFEVLDLGAEISDSLSSVEPLATNKGLELRFEPPAEPVRTSTDSALLGRILNNLLGNAIKFTEQGHVEVRLRTQAQEVVIEVADTGIGISDEFLAELFEEFKQESSGWSRAYEGTGLGLAITKRLCGVLGGRVDADSVKGEGSVFSVYLPKT